MADDLNGIPPPEGLNFAPTAWGGRTYDVQNGRYQMGTSGADRDVNRYREMSYGMGTRSFAPLDYRNSNSLVGTQGNTYGSALQQAQSGYGMRDQQADATGLMRNAAYGNAPSQAEIAGRQAMQQGLQNRLAAAASARGGAESQASAMRQAQAGGAAYEQNAIQSIAAARAAEMAQARGAYGQQLAQVRGQDYAGAGVVGGLGAQQAQQAQAQGQYDMQGNALNQQGQLAYEGMAFDTRKAQQQGAQFDSALRQGAYDAAKQRDQQDSDRFQRYLGSAMSFGGGLLGGLMSDNRAKTPAQPSYGKAMGAGMQQAGAELGGASQPSSSFLDAYMKTLQQHGTEDQKQAASPSPAAGIIRENPYGGSLRTAEDDAQGYDGGINRVDPYGSGEYTISDDAAKREAFWAGATYGMNPQRDVNPATGQPYLPSYARKQEPPDKAQPSSAGAGPTYGEWSRKHPPKKDEPVQKPAAAPKSAPAPLPGPKPQAALQEDANRAGAGFTYAYKDQFAPPTQAPGEVNYGPSAQQLAANPLTATAVKQTPEGLLAIDKEKLLKSNTAGIASLQEQIDQLRGGYRG